jgi:hypothetical protein
LAIKVREYRALEIDLSEVGPDDALMLYTERGTPVTLTFAQESTSCLRRWCYEREHMFDVDARKVDDVIDTAFTPDERAEATIKVYVPFVLKLDEPLECTVEASWPDNPEKKGKKLRLGNFQSGGGRVLRASAVTLTTARA